ncbi:MAG: antitoxin family protein [Anaerolineales bacterium]|nr:antitoxin family protein [Anaerolineales bacterium]
MTEYSNLPARYSKGNLRLRRQLNLPEGTEVRVTIKSAARRTRRGVKRAYQYPTRVVAWEVLDRLTGIVSLGGDALADSEVLYDRD